MLNITKYTEKECKNYNFDCNIHWLEIISRIRNSQIFKTWLIAIFSSFSIPFGYLTLKFFRIASFRFNRAQITNGNPNLALYNSFNFANKILSSLLKQFNPAWLCSLALSFANCPVWASLPPRSGIPLNIPALTKKKNSFYL